MVSYSIHIKIIEPNTITGPHMVERCYLIPLDINRVVNQIVTRHLDTDLIHACENSNFRGVMYTIFLVYHVPVIVKNDVKGSRQSIRRCCREICMKIMCH